MKSSVSEGYIQQQIVLCLQANGLFFWSTPNEAGGRSAVMQSRLVGQGLRPGIPDLFVMIPSMSSRPVLVGLEVKTDKGVLSDRQKAIHVILRKLKVPVFVVRSVYDLDKVLGYLDERFGWRMAVMESRFGLGKEDECERLFDMER